MDEFWATRTGRWRAAMRDQTAPTFAERLYAVIRADVKKGSLPAGAILPHEERVAQELAIETADVRDVYARLVAEGVIARRTHGMAYVPASDGEPEPSHGEATQIRFEAALLRAVREAAARGLSSAEATGMFKAAMLRAQSLEQDEQGNEKRE
jgi:DNA-binding FadR family transcriptional regulator